MERAETLLSQTVSHYHISFQMFAREDYNFCWKIFAYDFRALSTMLAWLFDMTDNLRCNTQRNNTRHP